MGITEEEIPAAGGGGSGGGVGLRRRRCEMAETVADTRRLITKLQNLNDAYGPPSNFLEIDVSNPQTVGEIRVKTNLPIFKLQESTVRRRYSDFEWLRSELERESKVVRFCGSFLSGEMIFDDNFIEERKQGLEQFINKVAGHPLTQNE
ncbi:sorting nexin-3, partial [Sigmodon hispidus]